MRALTNSYGTVTVNTAVEHEATIELQDLSSVVGNPAQAEIEHSAQRSPVTAAVRIVGVLAFGQSLLFAVLWLLLCASAGAATPTKKVEFNPTLPTSNFTPKTSRDPFAKVAGGTAASPVAVVMPALQLDGILYEATNPSASVNGQLLTLNKTVRLDPLGANIPVKAVAITRKQVTLEINGQKVELYLNSENTPAAPVANR